MQFTSESFAQVMAGGVLLSHFPSKSGRRTVLAEMYRVLQPGGVLIINGHNIYRDRYLQIIKRFMQFVRLFGNTYKYGENDLPRLGGRNGRIDPFFFRKNKSTLHYFWPIEFMVELLSAGFTIVDFNYNDNKACAECKLFDKQPWVMFVCRKS